VIAPLRLQFCWPVFPAFAAVERQQWLTVLDELFGPASSSSKQLFPANLMQLRITLATHLDALALLLERRRIGWRAHGCWVQVAALHGV